MQSYIFLDLDDTLFQTLRKCVPGVNDHDLQVRAVLPDGTANSFATQKQQWLWHWLSKGFKIVPVTARDVHAFERVNLPFLEEVVLNHGAVILDKQRKLDPVWQDNLMQTLPEYHQKLLGVWAEVERYAQHHPGFKPRIVNDFGINFGTSIPVNNLSLVNMAMKVGRRGTADNGLIREAYFNFTLGFSLNDNSWFYKRVFE